MDMVSVIQQRTQEDIHSSSRPEPAERTLSWPLLSIVTPAYNEADNLPRLFERLCQVLGSLELDWEWIIVDDHSSDGTFAVIRDLASQAPVRGFRFSRNHGAHTAITCGMHHARGNCAVIMAADLQDPPETLPQLLAEWQSGAQVVWAVREHREGEKASTIGFSRLYYWLMRRVVGIKEMPVTGADFFLIDRRVVDALNQFSECNTSLMALITWMGFQQKTITYDKQARLHGKSGWSLEKKLKLVVDSVTSFTYLPLRLMSYLGFIVAFLGFLYAGWVIINGIIGRPAYGWSSLMVVVLTIGGIQMIMMGVLGEYLWRTLDEARRRPRYILEAMLETESSRPGEYHASLADEPARGDMLVPKDVGDHLRWVTTTQCAGSGRPSAQKVWTDSSSTR